MMAVVSYDVSTVDPLGSKRLRKVAKVCGTLLKVKNELEKIIDKERDSIRIYYLGNNWKNRVEHIGAKETYVPEGVLIL